MKTVLFSGGIDSWACLNWAIDAYGKENVQAMYVDCHQQYVTKEMKAAIDLTRMLKMPLKILDAGNVLRENKEDGHIPLRNTMLMLLAASQPNCEGVVFGMLKGESCEDKNPKYIALMQKLFDSQFQASIYRKTTHPFEIHTPFQRMTKSEVVKWCMNHKTAASGLLATVACFAPSEKPCGECISCFNRWSSLVNNGGVDDYMRSPFHWMVDQIRGIRPNENRALFSLRQIWLKRSWLLESFHSMNTYAKAVHQRSLLSYLRSS